MLSILFQVGFCLYILANDGTDFNFTLLRKKDTYVKGYVKSLTTYLDKEMAPKLKGPHPVEVGATFHVWIKNMHRYLHMTRVRE